MTIQEPQTAIERLRAKAQDQPFPTRHPLVQNPDGTQSNVKTITMEADGRHYVIPSMVEGKQLTDNEAWNTAVAAGLQNYPAFDTAEKALQASKDLHDKQKPPAKQTAIQRLRTVAEQDPDKKPRTAIQRLRTRAEPRGAWSGITESAFGKYGVGDWLPWIGFGRQVLNYTIIASAAEAWKAGEHTPEQQRMLEDYYDYYQRPTEAGYLVGSILQQGPAFAGGIGVQSFLLKAMGKTALKTAGGRAFQEFLEKQGRKVFGEMAEREAFAKGAAALTKVAGKGAGLTAVHEAIGVPAGASMVLAGMRQLMFERDFKLTSDQSGRLQIAMAQQRTTMFDVLPQSLVRGRRRPPGPRS